MAGIGFILKKLTQREDLLGLVDAFIRASIISAGPWILTVLTLSTIMMFGRELLPFEEAFNFQSIIIYNFCFSLVLTAPISLTTTRYLADTIYAKDVSGTPGMLFGALSLVLLIEGPIACILYFGIAKLTFLMALLAVINFLLIAIIWMVAIYLTALVAYDAVTGAFFAGLFVSLILTVLAALYGDDETMLAGFSLGMAVIIALLITQILSEYPYPFKEPYAFLGAFREYWEVALSGLFFNMAIWVDKWVMWTSPDRLHLPNNLIIYPHYDASAFMANLITIPAMAIFLIFIETEFFEKYLRFYEEIRQGATMKKIISNQEEIWSFVLHATRRLLIAQVLVAILVIGIAPTVFEAFGINFMQLGMFRMCVIGASYQILILFLSILLWYFDNRRDALLLHIFYFISNGVLTYISMELGFSFYGAGFALSAILSCLFAAYLIEREVTKLPYHTFVTHNTSLRARHT